MMKTRAFVAAGLSLALAGCAGWVAPPPGIGREVAWPALRKSCEKLVTRDATWESTCLAARALESPDDATARAFFETHFRVHRVNAGDGREGLITGYYEPVLNGSKTRDERFRWPLYKRPDNLLTIDLASLYPELKGRPVRGRVV